MKNPLIECRVVALPRTRSYGYRLKGLDKMIGFTLEVHSEAHALFNDRLRINKRRKNCITFSIEEVIKWGKERIGKPRINTSTFIQIIKNEVGESGQKIFDRIFELALQRYHELEAEGYGKVPTLLSRKVVAPSPRPKPRPRPAPTPTPRPERQSSEPTQPTEKIRRSTSDIDKLKEEIPQHLHKHLKFECDLEKKKIIVTQTTAWIEMEEWLKIANVSKKYNGRYKNNVFTFPLPLEVTTKSYRG